MKSAVDYGSKPPVIGKRILLTEPWLKVEVGGGGGESRDGKMAANVQLHRGERIFKEKDCGLGRVHQISKKCVFFPK